MKDLYSIPIDKLTLAQQQAYDKTLRFMTWHKKKNLRHVYRGKYSGHFSIYNLKTSNDCGIGLRSIEYENKQVNTLDLLRLDD